MSDKNNSIQVLFSREEIDEIDELISCNMESQMDVLLNNYIRKILIAQFSQQFGANNTRASNNFEVSIIELFNQICEQKRVTIQRLQTEIHHLSCEKVERDQMIKKICEKCDFYQKMEIQYQKLQSQNKQLLLKEQQIMSVREKVKNMEQKIMKNQKDLQQVPILLQKANENGEFKEQLAKLHRSLRQSNERNQKLLTIQQELNKTKQQLQQKSSSLQIVTQQIAKLHEEISQLKKIKEKSTVLTQTDQILPQAYPCSLIKKQFIHQSMGRIQTEQSSYRICSSFENKQNIPITDSFQKIALTQSQKRSYKQKIFTLNEIINYLINFAKGYSEDNIRRGSWFYSRIALHGEEYEKKLMNPHHLEPKKTNMKFIRQLVKKDNNCAKLIKEFQSIINFYCQQILKQYTNNECHYTPSEQQKLNKTVNKFKNHGNQNIPHLL